VRAQRPPCAVGLETEERLESGVAAHQVTYDGEDRIIIDADCPSLAFLGDVVEGNAVPRERDIPLLERGRAIVMIELGVLLAAYAEKAEVDQPDRGGSHPITIEIGTTQVPRGSRPQFG